MLMDNDGKRECVHMLVVEGTWARKRLGRSEKAEQDQGIQPWLPEQTRPLPLRSSASVIFWRGRSRSIIYVGYLLWLIGRGTTFEKHPRAIRGRSGRLQERGRWRRRRPTDHLDTWSGITMGLSLERCHNVQEDRQSFQTTGMRRPSQ